MDEFTKLRSELARVKNISALARETNLSRDHLQRIRDGKVDNTTLRTMAMIRDGIRRMGSANRHAPEQEAA